MAPASTQPDTRLAEVVASLSLATDLATGQALEHSLRRALLAFWLGEELGVADSLLSDVFYVSLIATVGCALEMSALSPYVRDEIALAGEIVKVNPTRRRDAAAFFLGRVGAGEAPLQRAQKIVTVAMQGPTQSAMVCRDVAMQVGDMLDLGPSVREAVGQCHEQWNGRGWPRGLQGEEISLPARLVVLAHDLEISHRLSGIDAAVTVARRRSGKQYDPRIVTRFCEQPAQLLQRLDAMDAWDAVLATEPKPPRILSVGELDRMTEAIANFVDARSSYTLGHSRAVAHLAEGAARRLGLSDDDATALRWAGLLHDLGRAGVPVTVWNKTGELSEAEWERVKRHPALTEQMLARSHALGRLGILAGLHHERLDGSGYRNVPASFMPVAARVLAVADAYQTKLEPRPHRPALAAEEAAAALDREVRAGRLDAEAVASLLANAGREHAVAPKREWPAGLSDREVEVLGLAVRGLSNREIAELLFLSPKTVGHHIERIYEKIGVSTRVGATLFALQNDLISLPS